MIYLSLNAQFGNQLFEYAAVKTLADERGFQFIFGGKNSLDSLKLDNSRLFQKAFSKLNWYSNPRLLLKISKVADQIICQQFKTKFQARYKKYSEDVTFECFDSSFFEINDNTLVRGFFQSEKYFRHNRDQVLNWFTPKSRYIKSVKQIEALINVPPGKRVCIHLRRGDYATVNMGLAKGNQGWLLPIDYYKKAIQQLPEDLFYIVISDEPDFAENALDFLPNKLIARGNPPVVDMFLMTRCRFNIIANSSLSWWGAWLNQLPDRVVFAPKYHLGWAKGFWVPDEIKVPEWNYIDVLSLL